MTKTQKFISIGLIALLYVAVFVLEQLLPAQSMIFTVLKKGAIYALVAVSMNLLNGFTGLFSLGQAGFMLIGAYVYGIFTIPTDMRTSVYQYFSGGIIQFTLPVLVAIVLAGLVAAIAAAFIGIPALRLKSDYLAIATLGFAEIIRAIFQWDKLGPVTNGSNLLRKFPTFNDFNITNANGDVTVYLSTLVPFLIVGACILLIVLIIKSSYGRVFRAIRDDERAAEAMGVNLFAHKELSFVISSFFAGIGGALLAMYQMTIQASAFKSAMTYEILLIVVIGGIGSVTGSCIGSFLYIAASEWWLRGLDSGKFLGISAPTIFRSGFRKVVFAVIIMAVVLFYRKGLMGDHEFSVARIGARFRRLFRRRVPEEGGASENVLQIETEEQKKYRTLGGWMLFIVITCAISTISYFVAGGYSIYTVVHLANLLGVSLSGLTIPLVIAAIALLVGALLDGILVIMMAKRNPNFLKYYEILLLVGILVGILAAIGGSWEVVGAAVSVIIGFFIWTTYFRKSVRVHVYMGGDEYLRRSMFFKGCAKPANAVETEPAKKEVR